jgi:hypothetical protein
MFGNQQAVKCSLIFSNDKSAKETNGHVGSCKSLGSTHAKQSDVTVLCFPTAGDVLQFDVESCYRKVTVAKEIFFSK